MKPFFFFLLACTLLVPFGVRAADADPAFDGIVMRAQVVKILSSGEDAVAATTLSQSFQQLSVKVIDGPKTGQILEIKNDSPVMLAIGDVFYLHRIQAEDGSDLYAVGEPDRRWVLFGLGGLFVLVTILAAGRAGLQSILSLIVSFLVLIFGLVPVLSSGADPVFTSVSFSVLMLALAMFITHGVNRPTLIALAGSVAALAVAAGVAEIAVTLAKLSGFASDETVFLNFATNGALNLPALLLGGILVGIVGVLNDVSVSQVHTVIEIRDANPSLSRKEVWVKATRVGQEHLGAVVNTLPLAYAGASLPLLLLFYGSTAPALFILNREMFAVELIRTFAGGIGLMLSGVVATALAVIFLSPSRHRDRIDS